VREIVLDTETTGLEVRAGHRVIEIGCVELINRRLTGNNRHFYLNPDRAVDEGAFAVHGISDAFLADKPRFAAIADDLMEYLDGAQLVIHNAPFDVGFLNAELQRLQAAAVDSRCAIVDSLQLARRLHPGQKNNLDALCRRYDIDNSSRELHGALLDAEILAAVYLAMTGGQTRLQLSGHEDQRSNTHSAPSLRRLAADRTPLPVLIASGEEVTAHSAALARIMRTAGHCLWPTDQD